MLQKNSKLRVRLVAALMVLVSISSVPTTLAYKAPDLSESAETHDSSYVKELQNSAKNEFVSDSMTMTPAGGAPVPTEGEASAISPEGASSLFDDLNSSTDVSPEGSQQDTPTAPDKLDLEGKPLAALPPSSVTAPVEEASDVIVIDNDQYKNESKEESKDVSSWADVKAEDGKTVIVAGARFPVVLVSAHSSKSCRIGDKVLARLKADIIIGDRVIARKDAQVLGHVSSAHKARRLLVAEMAPKRWMRANGAIGIKFDEIITHEGEHIPLTAAPARMARIIENKAEGRVLGVNHKGEVVAPLSTQLKNQGIQVAIHGAAGVGGVFSMGAVPILFGLIGAANPSFAFLHPVGQNVRHRRWKGFGMGFLSGLPGGFLVANWILRGVESNLKPGDEFLVEFQQDFSGEVMTVAQLEPQEGMKVKGEVVRKKKSQKTNNKKKSEKAASSKKE